MVIRHEQTRDGTYLSCTKNQIWYTPNDTMASSREKRPTIGNTISAGYYEGSGDNCRGQAFLAFCIWCWSFVTILWQQASKTKENIRLIVFLNLLYLMGIVILIATRLTGRLIDALYPGRQFEIIGTKYHQIWSILLMIIRKASLLYCPTPFDFQDALIYVPWSRTCRRLSE